MFVTFPVVSPSSTVKTLYLKTTQKALTSSLPFRLETIAGASGDFWRAAGCVAVNLGRIFETEALECYRDVVDHVLAGIGFNELNQIVQVIRLECIGDVVEGHC